MERYLQIGKVNLTHNVLWHLLACALLLCASPLVLGTSNLGERDTAKVLENVEKIEKSASALLSLANNVLDMNEMQSGNIQMEKIPFRLVALCRETMENSRNLFPDNGLEFSFQAQAACEQELIGSPIISRNPFNLTQCHSLYAGRRLGCDPNYASARNRDAGGFSNQNL